MRLFVGVWPSAEVDELLASLARPHFPGVRWTPRPRLHVTLRFLGDPGVPGEVVADALAAVELPAPVTAVLGKRAGTFGGRVLYLPVGGLDELAAACDSALDTLGIGPRDRAFSGHLTLARSSRVEPIPPGALGDLPRDTPFTVTSFFLVDSVPAPGVNRYERLGEFPLRQGSAPLDPGPNS